jgi:long-chain acyl-CoA synthetase
MTTAMNTLPEILANMPAYGDTPAIVQLDEAGNEHRTSYAQLYRAATSIAGAIGQHVPRNAVVGLVASNSIAWAQADLALLLGHYTEVPVPLGFSAEQAAHLLASCELILADDAGIQRLAAWRETAGDAIPVRACLRIDELTGFEAQAPLLDWAGDWICKIIHTSGTTSTPKGVRIRAHALDVVLRSLRALTQPGDYARYLNLVPFSLLLEQITALYMPYAQQGCLILPPASQPPLGETGASIADKMALLPRTRPSALTLTPSMVEAISAEAARLDHGDAKALSMALFGRAEPPLLAAGGAPVSATTLETLKQRGIDVYVGYGLSENSSVACWNTRTAHRIGTVGRPMPHVQCKLSSDGELGIKSEAVFAGYVGSDPSACDLDDDGWLWTGDVAAIDKDGFVSVVGRKKNVIITTHGRNVSPEFVEASYRQVRGVREIVVLGDQRDSLSAFVVASADCDPILLRERLLEHGKTHLSDVERVTELVCLSEHDEELPKLFTLTGRPRRKDIEHYMKLVQQV